MPSRFAQRVVVSTLSRTIGVACAFVLIHSAPPICTPRSIARAVIATMIAPAAWVNA